MSKKIVIGGNQSQGFQYVYHRIIGDGHCFVNCYLESCSPTYLNCSNTSDKSKISRKLRIDFANYLMSDSKKTSEEISERLGFLNPSTMSKFLRLDQDQSSIVSLQDHCSNFNGNNADEIYSLILSSRYKTKNGVDVTIEYLHDLYKKDHRLTLAESDGAKPEDYGYGRLPITIRYYESVEAILPYKDLLKSIATLLSPFEFLNQMESTLIANYIGINATSFVLGLGYTQILDLVPRRESCPELLLINIGNVHWNMVRLEMNGNNQLILMGVPYSTKKSIYDVLKKLYEDRIL
uniref:Uncharacterized protein n=1 Tax=viral metagenome TaxID=1070528 RepID=A0A6C0BE91_9ZZZZ